MKRQDTVFLLTLIDFLFQVIFFGLFIYAIYAAKEDPNIKKAIESLKEKYKLSSGEDVSKVVNSLPPSLTTLQKVAENSDVIQNELNRQGVSNITELTDELSRLAPVKELAAVQSDLEKLGGSSNVHEISQLIERTGGKEQAKAILMKYVKEGVGKPHCEPIADATGKVMGANPIAIVTGYDDRLVFGQETPRLRAFLSTLGLEYKQVETLTPQQFKVVFKSVTEKVQGCVHTVTFREATRLVDARDAIRPYFRLHIRKVSAPTNQ